MTKKLGNLNSVGRQTYFQSILLRTISQAKDLALEPDQPDNETKDDDILTNSRRKRRGVVAGAQIRELKSVTESGEY